MVKRNKNIQKDNDISISLDIKGTEDIPFSLCQECWSVLTSVEEFRNFIRMRGIPTEISSFDNCCSVGTFLIGLEIFCSEDQLRILFYWLSEVMRSYFVSFGVTSKTPSVIFSSYDQRYSFFRFFAVLGYSIVKNSIFKSSNSNLKYSKECLDMLKRYGVLS